MLELNTKRLCCVRKRKNIPFVLKFLEKRCTNSGKKLIFWGFIWSAGERQQVPIKNKFDTEIYISILKEHFMNFLYIHDPFQRDKVPTHTAVKTKSFVGENGFTILKNRPAQLPDINISRNLHSISKIYVQHNQPKFQLSCRGLRKRKHSKITK